MDGVNLESYNMKSIISLIAVFACSTMVNAQELTNVNPDPKGEPWLVGGLRELTTDDYNQINATPRLTLTASQLNRDLPVSIDNSLLPWFRPVFNQDGGSCGQASGIGYNFTFEMDYLRGLPANTAIAQYPTHYTWNFLNGGTGGGSWYFDGWQIIAANGCPTVQTYGGTPWYGGDHRWMSGYDNYLSGMSNRMLEVSTIDVTTEEGLETLKHWMFDRLDGSPTGGLANFSAGVSDVFTMDYLPSGTPHAGQQIVTRWGQVVNHAMTFIGYDDSICYDVNGDGQYTNNLDITGDGIVDLRDWEIGGVIMMNSWGESFGNGGKAYVMYRTLALSVEEGGIWNNLLHVIRTRSDYQPQITLKATVKHTSRQKLKISAGISTQTNDTKPAHVLDFPLFNNQGGNYFMTGGETEADKSIELGLDITPLLSYVSPNQQARFFIQIIEQDPDGSSEGQITNLSLFDLNQSTEFESPMTNVLLENNDTTWAWTDAAIDFIPAEIITQSLPVAHVGESYSHQLEAAGAPGPYSWTVLQEYAQNDNQADFPAITSNQLVFSNNDDGFATQTIDFPFPYYGGTYQDLVITSDGSIAFGGKFEYVRSEGDLMSAKTITPYGADLMIYPEDNDGIYYEGDATHATFRWKVSKFDNISFNTDFAVTLYPDGKITFYYGDGITPSSEWASGISAGDNQNYIIAVNSGSTEIIPGSSIQFECSPLPSGMVLSSDGVYNGIPTQPGKEWNITFKAIASNSLFATRTITFSTAPELTIEPDTLLFENSFEGKEGKYFTIINTTSSDVAITSFETQGNISFPGGNCSWKAEFPETLPYIVSPAAQVQVLVRLIPDLTKQPIDTYITDTLNFETATDNYQVLLMFNDTINIYTGTKQNVVPQETLNIAPNPANGITQITFNANSSSEATLMIYDITGKLVQYKSLTGLFSGLSRRIIDISNLNPGIYSITLTSAERCFSARLVVR